MPRLGLLIRHSSRTDRLGSISLIVLLCVFFMILSCCGGPSDEESVLELMSDLVARAEARDLQGIMEYLDEGYVDFEERARAETGVMIQGYFDRYKGIIIHLLGTRIDELTPQSAALRSDIAFSSGAARVLRKLVRLSTDNYRLKVRLRKTGGRWLVLRAEWRPVGLGELFPESTSILRRLFPELF